MTYLMFINIIILIVLCAIIIINMKIIAFQKSIIIRITSAEHGITDNTINTLKGIILDIDNVSSKINSLNNHCSNTYKEIVDVHSYITELEARLSNNFKDIGEYFAKVTESANNIITALNKFENSDNVTNDGIKTVIKDCEKLESYLSELANQLSLVQENVLNSIEKTKMKKSSSSIKKVTTTDKIIAK